jgi:broad specificity phosphatase PhoE
MSKLAELPDDRPMTFGKYKGRTPEEVAKEDPVWLMWAYENASGPKPCSRELYLAADYTASEEEVGDPLDDEDEDEDDDEVDE